MKPIPVHLHMLRTVSPDAVAEFRFHPVRKWRMDYAIPSHRIGIEVDGGVWTGGRHSGGAGQIKDMEKMNSAALLGWRVLHYTPKQMRSNTWLADVRAIIAGVDDRPALAPVPLTRRQSTLKARQRATKAIGTPDARVAEVRS